MLVGHYAVGLIAKRAEPAINLGTFVLAAMFADFAWCVFSAPGHRTCAIQIRDGCGKLLLRNQHRHEPQFIDGCDLGCFARFSVLIVEALSAWRLDHLCRRSEPLAARLRESSARHADRAGNARTRRSRALELDPRHSPDRRRLLVFGHHPLPSRHSCKESCRNVRLLEWSHSSHITVAQ